MNQETTIKKKKLLFFEYDQNNTGGSFDVDDKLCHRLIIEAEDNGKADEIAENLGCYWDGVDNGMDCSCCGDRWYSGHELNFEEMNTRWNGYEISQWLKESSMSEKEAVEKLKSQYPGGTWLVEPILEKKYSSKRVVGKLKIENVEQYAQVMANLFGWTTPDIRIFYANGDVKEIFKDRETWAG